MAKSSSFARCVLLTGIIYVKEKADAKRQDRKSRSIMGEGSHTHTHRNPLIMSLKPGREIVNHAGTGDSKT